MILMAAGVALFGTFSGFLAAWFLGPEVEDSETDIAALHREIAALRESVEALGPSRPDPPLANSVDQSTT
jgi:voltage-gated potassium channel